MSGSKFSHHFPERETSRRYWGCASWQKKSFLRVWMSESAQCLRRQLSGNFGSILEPIYPIYSKMEERSRGPWVRDTLSLPLTHSSYWMDMSNLSIWSSYCGLVYPSERPYSFPCHSHSSFSLSWGHIAVLLLVPGTLSLLIFQDIQC